MKENNNTLKEHVYKKIKSDILNQIFKPGEILNERKLSESLNVSRTPVREALKTLEMESLIHYKPYVGAIVNEIQKDDFKNSFQIRKALEVLAAEIAYDKMNNETIRKLESCIQKQENLAKQKMNTLSQFMNLDMEFHNIIVEITGNQILRQFIWELRDKTHTLGVNALQRSSTRFRETIEEHRRILDAFKKNDLALIKSTMKKHIENTYLNAKKYIDTKS